MSIEPGRIAGIGWRALAWAFFRNVCPFAPGTKHPVNAKRANLQTAARLPRHFSRQRHGVNLRSGGNVRGQIKFEQGAIRGVVLGCARDEKFRSASAIQRTDSEESRVGRRMEKYLISTRRNSEQQGRTGDR